MRFFYLVLPLVFLSFLSCNKDEGFGGSSSVEGLVYEVVHSDDNYPVDNNSFKVDTILAAKKDVYLIFGNQGYFGDDVETDMNGFYRFDYLRKGNYTVYAYSEYADGRKEAITNTLHIGGGSTVAQPLYIHTGKAYGTAMIKGTVTVSYYNSSGSYQGTGPGIGIRVYIRYKDEKAPIDDVRTGDEGIFMFQKILPGEYVVFVEHKASGGSVTTVKTQTVTITEEDLKATGQCIRDVGEFQVDK
ncbi:MAG: hypothetical protein LBT48_05455 [Prevotellaceae bacterium]|jgi:hypothetical protein|nr:hypothetical protein [Prevotellaceae bacterium]